MDITVTASAKTGEWAMIDLLGRNMGRVAETEPGILKIRPQGQAVTTMAALTSKPICRLISRWLAAIAPTLDAEAPFEFPNRRSGS
jgi:hypothetical protein